MPELLEQFLAPVAAAYHREDVERHPECEECHQGLLLGAGEGAEWYGNLRLKGRQRRNDSKADSGQQQRVTTHGAPRAQTWRTSPKSRTIGRTARKHPGNTSEVDVCYSSTDFYEVMDMLDKRLNDKGKNWRHVLKSLKVLDYCLHEGSELVVTWARKNIYIIKTLREFIYLDEEGRDVGASSKFN